MYNAVTENVEPLRAAPGCVRPLWSRTGKRKRIGEDSYKTQQELWEQYMEVERRELEQRRNGQPGRELGRALPGESQDDLQRIAE
jgi:hypothetical protein